MQRTQVEGYEFSSTYLIRAFVEGTISLYLEKHLPEELKKEAKLHSKILTVCEHLQQNGVKKGKLQPLRIAASESNSMLSPFILGATIHLSIIPVKRELLSVWDRLEGALEIIHGKLQ